MIWPLAVLRALLYGAQGGNRTHTPKPGERILSPPRLPFRHLGTVKGQPVEAGACAVRCLLGDGMIGGDGRIRTAE